MTEWIIIVLLLVVIGLLVLERLSGQARQRASLRMDRDLEIVQNQLERIDKVQSHTVQNVEWMADLVENMSSTLSRPKSRGTWGEYQLESLLEAFAGKAGPIWDRQVKLENGKIADSVLLLPGSRELVCIDAKFPLDNFQTDRKAFKADLKKHVDDIAAKYITDQTADMALLFLPAEGVYQTVLADFDDLFQYALRRHVLLTGPSTLTGILTILGSAQKDWYRKEHLKEIEQGLNELQDQSARLMERARKTEAMSQNLADKYHEVYVSARKLHDALENVLEGGSK